MYGGMRCRLFAEKCIFRGFSLAQTYRNKAASFMDGNSHIRPTSESHKV